MSAWMPERGPYGMHLILVLPRFPDAPLNHLTTNKSCSLVHYYCLPLNGPTYPIERTLSVFVYILVTSFPPIHRDHIYVWCMQFAFHPHILYIYIYTVERHSFRIPIPCHVAGAAFDRPSHNINRTVNIYLCHPRLRADPQQIMEIYHDGSINCMQRIHSAQWWEIFCKTRAWDDFSVGSFFFGSQYSRRIFVDCDRGSDCLAQGFCCVELLGIMWDLMMWCATLCQSVKSTNPVPIFTRRFYNLGETIMMKPQIGCQYYGWHSSELKGLEGIGWC